MGKNRHIKNSLPYPTGIGPDVLTQSTDKQVAKNLANFPARVQLARLRQDVMSWRDSMTEAENSWYPQRIKQQQLYIDTDLNGHVAACIERRKDLTMLRKLEFVGDNDEVDEKTELYFKDKDQNKQWLNKFISHSLDAIQFGYTLISLGDVINDEFPNLDIVKRWNVSPDRLNVTNYTYSISGANFLEEPYLDWHLYVKTENNIGTSPCGYGLLYKVGIYEIFLRNILGFNGDFVELYSQPYRIGKTTKTNETERAELENAVRQMGSAGYAIIDPEDEISFLETALGGTGYLGYDNFEARLEKKISKLLLGHADALDSVPGKLGASGAKSPSQLALEDKQTKDGSFMLAIINHSLIPKMRKLGFDIPEDVKARYKNDAEVMETANTLADLAVKMKSGGLMMDSTYFEEQTGIKTSPIPVASPFASHPPPASGKPKEETKPTEDKPDEDKPTDKTETVKNRLKTLYGKSNKKA